MILITDRMEYGLVYEGFIHVFQCLILSTVYARLSGYVYKIPTGILSTSVYIRYLLLIIYSKGIPTVEFI